jgi:hypothetical protein
MQALPNTMHGGTITVTATAGMDSKTEVFDVHGIHLTGKANPSEGQEMKPGVGWYDSQRDILLFGMNRVAGKGLKLIGKATILLAGTCANKANCARNFELGFLQDLVHQERVVEYTARPSPEQRGRSSMVQQRIYRSAYGTQKAKILCFTTIWVNNSLETGTNKQLYFLTIPACPEVSRSRTEES